jgi:hypothetical protein
MNRDKRNVWVVVFLVLSMTLGAGVLFLLEGAAWRHPVTLAATTQQAAVERVEIRYVSPGERVDASEYDCRIEPGGAVSRVAPGPGVYRIHVVGSGTRHLQQGQSLLATLGWLQQSHGVDLRRVELESRSDVRRRPDLPADAADLLRLLEARGFVR